MRLVIACTLEGDEGFMAGHSWAYKLLDIGELWILEEDKGNYNDADFRITAIAGGFIDVKDSIIIYTDAAEWPEDIDMERVLSEKAKVEDWLTHYAGNIVKTLFPEFQKKNFKCARPRDQHVECCRIAEE